MTDSSGPVALVGSGEYLPVLEPLERRLLDGRPRRFVQLATAAAPEGQASLARWHELGRAAAERLGVQQVVVPVVDRVSADGGGGQQRDAGREHARAVDQHRAQPVVHHWPGREERDAARLDRRDTCAQRSASSPAWHPCRTRSRPGRSRPAASTRRGCARDRWRASPPRCSARCR